MPNNQTFRYRPQPAERHSEPHHITHFSDFVINAMKEVIVLETAEHTSNHAVLELVWALESGDFAFVDDSHTKLFRLPPNPLPKSYHAPGHAPNGPDLKIPRRLKFQIDAEA